jgi:hypothetical protein
MKLGTVVIAAGAAAVGYVLGTKAGRAQFERIKARAGELVNDPRVQSGVSNVAGEVRKNANRLPDPVAGVVRTAAEKVETATKQPTTTPGMDSPGMPSPGSPTSDVTSPGPTSDTPPPGSTGTAF